MCTMSGTTPAPAQPRGEIVPVDAIRIHVLSAGDGSPLVYLHGAGDLGGWLPALGALATTFRVVRPDHPGFNRSDDDPTVDSVGTLARRYLGLLDALGLVRVHLVGTSLGGWLAAEIALRAPQRVDRLVLVDPAGLPPETPVPNMFETPPEELLVLLCGDEDSLAAGRARAAAVRDDAVLVERRTRNTATAARLAREPYMHDPGLGARLGGLQVPTLVVWGALDGLFPVDMAHQWTRVVPSARLHVVEGAGHLPPADRPEEFVRIVCDFLSDAAGPADAPKESHP
jgi:pimeloyl-ACP methyl ester carboxylesterase